MLSPQLTRHPRFEIAQSSSVWASFIGPGVKVGAAAAAADSNAAQWTKWFGGGGGSASEGQILRVHRKGCAVAACYGQRLKNMIGQVSLSSCPSIIALFCAVAVTQSYSVHWLCHSAAIHRLCLGSDGGGAGAPHRLGIFRGRRRCSAKGADSVIGSHNGTGGQRCGHASLEAAPRAAASSTARETVLHGVASRGTLALFPFPIQIQLCPQAALRLFPLRAPSSRASYFFNAGAFAGQALQPL